MSSLISLEAVRFCRGARRIFDALSLQVEAGEVVALLGPSGAGKSTIVRLLLGFLAPERGVVRIRDEVVAVDGRILVPPEARNLAVVFQDLALWPHLSVEGNLRFGLRAKGVKDDEARGRIASLVDRLGLAGLLQRRPAALSGGERQRVAIARALVLEPEVVLLDEPLSDLDITLRSELLDLFAELFGELPGAAIYVTHDPLEAQRVADRVIVIDAGGIVFSGHLDDLGEESQSRFLRDLRRGLRRS